MEIWIIEDVLYYGTRQFIDGINCYVEASSILRYLIHSALVNKLFSNPQIPNNALTFSSGIIWNSWITY